MTYLAKCTSECKSFKGDSGNVWVKIDQMAYDTSKTPPWGSDMLAKQGAAWTVTVPPNLAPGQYVLRHEILGLHVAGTRNGAQFYPSCAHLTVSGSGTQQLPSGVALPGAYNPDDTKGVSTILLSYGHLSHAWNAANHFLIGSRSALAGQRWPSSVRCTRWQRVVGRCTKCERLELPLLPLYLTEEGKMMRSVLNFGFLAIILTNYIFNHRACQKVMILRSHKCLMSLTLGAKLQDLSLAQLGTEAR